MIVFRSTVDVTIHFNHTVNSTAYAFDLSIQLFVPMHLTYVSTAGYAFLTPTVTYTNSTGESMLTYDVSLYLLLLRL